MAPSRLTKEVPEHLLPHIAEQDPSLYTPIDHASWRFILKIAQAFFADHAHQKYLDGLKETGISTDRIPLISEMDACLRKFNWRAVGVVGFIPPSAFMEFLSLGILPIACDMRRLEHLDYTPAPDIVHEAAGHAPIIADPDYSAYLREYGEISRKAIFSKQDLDLYTAIRQLSDIKEDPASTAAQIAEAGLRYDRAVESIDYISEAAELARMAWWTIEYGLVGDFDHPKIYGAGLLSSVSESYHCLGTGVRKLPMSVDCIKTNYDITQPQPQLFVAKDFAALSRSLDQLAEKMAFRVGGSEGLERAIRAGTATTAVLDSGLQISGIIQENLRDSSGNPAYLVFTGPTQLSLDDLELEGQGPDYHLQGYGTPVGLARTRSGATKTAGELTLSEWAELGFKPGANGRLEYVSGVVVEGELTGRNERGGRTLILTFRNCSVRLGDRQLFQPEWGNFDLASGAKVTSVFGGAADRRSYLIKTGGLDAPTARPKSNLTAENRALNTLYARVRALRDDWDTTTSDVQASTLAQIHSDLEASHPDDWLLRYELLELDARAGSTSPWRASALRRLAKIAETSNEKAELIARGQELLK